VITKGRPQLANPVTKQHFWNLTNQWYNLLPSKKVYTYDYYLQNSVGRSTQGVPMFFPHLTSEDLKFHKGKSSGEFIEISSTTVWPPYDSSTKQWNLKWDAFAANSLNTYVTSRLYWDADLDVDALMDEYYILFYGPASSQMKAFGQYSEAHLSDVLKDPIVIPTMREMLANARSVAGNTIYGHRIDLLIGMMNSVGTGTMEINSCQTLSSASTTYKLTADVSSTGTCFTIGNAGITLDCQGRSITFGTGGGSDVHGVFMPWNSGIYGTTIKNCKINYLGTSQSGIEAIHFSRSHNVLIANNIINTSASQSVWLIASNNINVTNNTIYSASSNVFALQEIWLGSISNNRFIANSGSAGYFYDVNNVSMNNNNLSSISSYGLNIVKGGNNTFIGNRFTSVTGTGLRQYSTSGNVFVNNVIQP
jgi:hypothetical protein